MEGSKAPIRPPLPANDRRGSTNRFRRRRSTSRARRAGLRPSRGVREAAADPAALVAPTARPDGAVHGGRVRPAPLPVPRQGRAPARSPRQDTAADGRRHARGDPAARRPRGRPFGPDVAPVPASQPGATPDRPIRSRAGPPAIPPPSRQRPPKAAPSGGRPRRVAVGGAGRAVVSVRAVPRRHALRRGPRLDRRPPGGRRVRAPANEDPAAGRRRRPGAHARAERPSGGPSPSTVAVRRRRPRWRSAGSIRGEGRWMPGVSGGRQPDGPKRIPSARTGSAAASRSARRPRASPASGVAATGRNGRSGSSGAVGGPGP